MPARYWVHHPLMRPWVRAFVSDFEKVPNLTTCTLFYPRVVNEGTEHEGVVLTLEHFVEKSAPEAIDAMKKWIEAKFGSGIKMKSMSPDEPDWR